jgi:hypothetical protein
MGIEELIGFLLGVGFGRLLQCFRSGESSSTTQAEAPVVQLTETEEPISTASTETMDIVPPEPPKPSEQPAASPVVTEEAAIVQQIIAESSPPPASSPEVEERRNDLKAAILEIIRSAEGGITLSAIAEQMKRHFASIIGPVRLLIEEGLVEKQDKLYKIRGTA